MRNPLTEVIYSAKLGASADCANISAHRGWSVLFVCFAQQRHGLRIEFVLCKSSRNNFSKSRPRKRANFTPGWLLGAWSSTSHPDPGTAAASAPDREAHGVIAAGEARRLRACDPGTGNGTGLPAPGDTIPGGLIFGQGAAGFAPGRRNHPSNIATFLRAASNGTVRR